MNYQKVHAILYPEYRDNGTYPSNYTASHTDDSLGGYSVFGTTK
jgi:hypothetical protein